MDIQQYKHYLFCMLTMFQKNKQKEIVQNKRTVPVIGYSPLATFPDIIMLTSYMVIAYGLWNAKKKSRFVGHAPIKH